MSESAVGPERYVSTGRLPRDERVSAALTACHSDLVGIDDGEVSDVYPVLAQADPALFGLAVVSVDGHEFLGLNGGSGHPFSEAVSFQIFCADQAEVDHYWDALTADGGEEWPCGWLKDKFGVSWQVTPTRLMELLTQSDQATVARVTQCFMQMTRLDLAEIERAAAAG